MLCTVLTINCTGRTPSATKTTINQSIKPSHVSVVCIICHSFAHGKKWRMLLVIFSKQINCFEWFISLCYYISLVIDYSHDGYVWIKQSTDIAVNLNSADGHFDNSCFLKQIKSKHMEEEFEDTKGVIRIRI